MVVNEVAILRLVGSQPHCVAIHGYYLEGAIAYVVMERCDTTLLEALESGPEPTERTLAHIFREMLQALSSVHALMVVHRDIKADNFLCSGEERTIKLCDFGLSALLPKRTGELRGLFGTPPFMSPEMLRGGQYGTSTDIWSLGALAYVLLCGQFAYQPPELTAKTMKMAIAAGTPEPTFQPADSLNMAGSGPSPAALAFLHALLDRNNARRPTAADALQLKWLASKVDPRWEGPSLQPMLEAAKRLGAFETRAPKDLRQSNLDHMLASLQAKHRCDVRHTTGTCWSDSTYMKTDVSDSGKGSIITSDQGSWTSSPEQADTR